MSGLGDTGALRCTRCIFNREYINGHGATSHITAKSCLKLVTKVRLVHCPADSEPTQARLDSCSGVTDKYELRSDRTFPNNRLLYWLVAPLAATSNVSESWQMKDMKCSSGSGIYSPYFHVYSPCCSCMLIQWEKTITHLKGAYPPRGDRYNVIVSVSDRPTRDFAWKMAPNDAKSHRCVKSVHILTRESLFG